MGIGVFKEMINSNQHRLFVTAALQTTKPSLIRFCPRVCQLIKTFQYFIAINVERCALYVVYLFNR